MSSVHRFAGNVNDPGYVSAQVVRAISKKCGTNEITKHREDFVYICGGTLLAFVLCFGVVPLLIQRMQLSIEASKAIDVLEDHGLGAFRVTTCQRKFTGIVLEGQVASEDEADEVETVLRNADIEADVLMTFCSNDGIIDRAIFRTEADDDKPSPE